MSETTEEDELVGMADQIFQELDRAEDQSSSSLPTAPTPG
jgi:hypothetical protein